MWDIIGRSVVVAEGKDDFGETDHKDSKVEVACAISSELLPR